MKRLLPYLFAVVCLLVAVSSTAQSRNDLYQAEVEVKSNSEAQRKLAVAMALSKVLVKVSGNSAITTVPAVSDKLNDADNLVYQYSFISAEGQDNNTKLRVQFLSDKVHKFLQSVKQPVWLDKRPTMVVWLLESGHTNTFVNNSETSTLRDIIASVAEKRGLQMLFPLFDLNDMNSLSSNKQDDEFAGFMQASQRYSNGLPLVIKLKHMAGNKWQADCVLMLQQENLNWQEMSDSAETVLQLGMDAAVDALAVRFAEQTIEGENNQLQLLVENIKSVDDYVKLTKYLQSLSLVNDVQVVSIDPEKILYHLDTQLERKAVIDALAKNASILPLEVSDEEGLLYYRFAS